MDPIRNLHKELRILLENSPVGIVLTDMQFKFVYVNPGFCKMLGYSQKEMLTKNIVELTHPDSINKSKEAIEKAFKDKVNVTLEKKYIHKDGSHVDAITRIAPVLNDDNQPLYQCTNVENITERKQYHDMLKYQASHDDLTTLINRREFETRITQLLNNITHNNSEHALLYLDLDQFKVVNDTCGHAAGDNMLRQLSETISKALRKSDILARLGGDEFGILIKNCSIENAYNVAVLIQKTIQDFTFSWERLSFRVGVSIGLCSINKTTSNLSTLLKDVDAACYMAKDSGRNRIQVCGAEDVNLVKHHGEMQWIVRINKALDNNEFCLYAQPIVPIDGSKGDHYELLVRMIGNEGEIIPPGSFLPAAEKFSIISKVDQWVIQNAFKYFNEQPSCLENIICCSINLSGQSLTTPNFLNFIIEQFQKFDINPEKICFEITETAAISNLNTAKSFISTLKKMGCHFALDDFGSGLSSFAYLKDIPVDYLKIDGIFVKGIVDDSIDYAMVKSINEIGHLMGIKTIAEFVESEEIEHSLKEIGVNYVQGFAVGKPIPITEMKI